jgi:hypothetical protein
MHDANSAEEMLEFLWHNYITLSEQVDPEAMPQDTRALHLKNKTLLRPLRIATWLARLGQFITVWTLWEYYARGLCGRLTAKEKKIPSESTVAWIARSLSANGIGFPEKDWFKSANSLRNLIAHYGTLVSGSESQRLLERSRVAFPTIQTWQDGYVEITHEHLADLHIKVEDFIRETA